MPVSVTLPTVFWLTCCGLLFSLILHFVKTMRRRRLVTQRQLARLAENERIAKSAHEALMQDVQSLVLRLQVAADCMYETSEFSRQMEIALKAADGLLARGRAQSMGWQLSLKFRGELEQLFAELGLALSEGVHAKFSLIVCGDDEEPDAATRHEIYRIGREALFNAFCHAKANNVEMELIFTYDRFGLYVRDDGIGFDPVAINLAAYSGHRGLMLMRERARTVRGRLHIWSGFNIGTEVALEVPLKLSAMDGFEEHGWRAHIARLMRHLSLPA